MEEFLGFGGDGGSIRRLERLGIREDARTFGGVGEAERRQVLSNCVIRAVVYIVLEKLLFRARHHLATTVALQVSTGQKSDHPGWPIGIARDIILE